MNKKLLLLLEVKTLNNMPLFQNSVIAKYLKKQNKELLSTNWHTYKNHFQNPNVQEEIKSLKKGNIKGSFWKTYL